ncbi:MAG: acyl-CoA synthetase [Acidisphaera sp.]|nr:acyl-CoA synthetase [Acidisphaera sp.]
MPGAGPAAHAACFPLVGRAAGDILFRGPEGAFTAKDFLLAVHRLAAALPQSGHYLNLCQDRRHFAVAFAATVLRGQVSLLTSDRSEARLRRLAERFPGCCAVTEEAADLPLPQHRFALHSASPAPGGMDNPMIPAGQPAALVFTSGSTGEPVAHGKSWGALATRSAAAAERFGLAPAAPASIVGMVPPQHMYGFETTILLPLHAPVSVWCGPAFYKADVEQALAAVPGPRVLVTTPLQLRALLAAGIRISSEGIAPVERVISATAPLYRDLAGDVERAWGTSVCEIYGATEVGSIASRRTVAEEDWQVYPSVRLEPCLDGVQVLAPYAEPTGLNDEVAFAGTDRFSLLGRKTDIVKLAGKRASLAGLNRILNEIDGVQDGLFVAPDDLEERPTARLLAYVVAPERSSEDILAALRGRIDPVFLPRRVVRVDGLPRNELGKLPRQVLATLHDAAGRD